MKDHKRDYKAPFIAEWLLNRLTKSEEKFSVLGDLDEEFNEKAQTKTALKARFWYWKQIARAMPVFFKYSILRSGIMFKNYVKIALRNVLRHKVHSFVNVSGLSLGLACSILIYLYVADEFSYDKFHENKDSLYRIVRLGHNKDGSLRDKMPYVPIPMMPVVKEYFPEVKNSLFLSETNAVIRYGDKMHNEQITFTGASFFEAFSFPLISGNASTVLSTVDNIVLTKEAAIKYFGDENPVGKSLQLIFGDKVKLFEVSGVSEKISGNSTIQFDFLINYENIRFVNGPQAMDHWGGFYATGYVQLEDSTSPETIEGGFDGFVETHFASLVKLLKNYGMWEGEGIPFSFGLQKIADMHLDKSVGEASSGATSSYILSGIALMILLIACINFTNLSIGRSSLRSTEIGVRKVVGAARKQLIAQFWSESLFVVAISAIMGITLIYFTLPTFNDLAGKDLTLYGFTNPFNLLILVFLIAVVGLLVGSYPAFVMSAIRTTEILKGKMKFGGKNLLTKSLVVMQFSLSVLLLIGTIVASEQITFMNTKALGFQKDGIIVVDIQERSASESERVIKNIKERIQSYSDIISITSTSNSFGKSSGRTVLKRNGETITAYEYRVDYDYLKTLGITLTDGRNFSPEMTTDSTALIVNQKLLEKLEDNTLLDNPLKEYGNRKVIGVVSDYNMASLRSEIDPVLLMVMNTGGPWRFKHMLVRVAPTNISNSLKIIRDAWSEVQPDKPFEYSFMDEDIASMYNDEQKWGAIVSYSSAFAILISCMGIFGLTSIAINKRIKEIGIRKVLGAKVSQIIKLVTREFMLLIIIANVIAWPLSFYIMDTVLSNYHYRIAMGMNYFFFAGALSLGIALLTMMYHVLKAAIANPVQSLRYE